MVGEITLGSGHLFEIQNVYSKLPQLGLPLVEHDERYEIADEYLRVLYKCVQSFRTFIRYLAIKKSVNYI